MLRSNSCKHSQSPLSLWNILSHELCQSFPLLFLFWVAIGLVLFDNLHHFVTEDLSSRRITTREKFHVDVTRAVTLAHVHFLQHLHGDEGVFHVYWEEEAVLDE